ncbi:uncharacterized protein RAG0_14854 [Rhynchosporium agropyri]|uniref:Uncharacterized protein n=1 Tax=Rhynchosporium agropyri TaxID=914238 RepID=A0A1E1LIP4_9HELO|nr:uncharacterized protein RAG0_14854 [Rhynchosporium agropyri]
MANRHPLPPRHRPRTPENERAEIITHEPASWNSYRQTSSRGQLVRDFMESGLPEARAKVRVEEEFTARKPRIAPPRRRPSLTSAESEPGANGEYFTDNAVFKNQKPISCTYGEHLSNNSNRENQTAISFASVECFANASIIKTQRSESSIHNTNIENKEYFACFNSNELSISRSITTSQHPQVANRNVIFDKYVGLVPIKGYLAEVNDSTVRPSRSQQKKPATRNLSPASERERRRLRQKLLDEGTPVDMVNEMMNGLSVSESSRSRESSPAPTSRSHATSSSRQSSPQRRGRSRSPYIDPRPPIEEMSLNMLRQEVAEEGRDQDFIDILLLRGANLGSLNTGTSKSSARARMRSRDRDAIPLGLVWSDDPVKEREMRRASLIEHGFPARGVKLFLDEQWGPAAPASLALAAQNPVYAEHGGDIKVEGNAVVEREKQRQAVLESDFLHQSEKGIRLMLDEIYGPETREARAHRKPGPDWMRAFAIMKLRYGLYPSVERFRSSWFSEHLRLS